MLRFAPTDADIVTWCHEGWARAVDGCLVEPEGRCEHGELSWLVHLGILPGETDGRKGA